MSDDGDDYDWDLHHATSRVLALIGSALVATSRLATTASAIMTNALRGTDGDIARLVLQKQSTSGILTLIKGVAKTPLMLERDPQLAADLVKWVTAHYSMLTERNNLAHGSLFVGEGNSFSLWSSGVKANPVSEIDADQLADLTARANELNHVGVKLLFRFNAYLDSVGIANYRSPLRDRIVDG